MKPIPFEVGRVVLSKQGRDKGRYMIVVAPVDEEFVLVADGELRRLSKPKRKRMKHLSPKPALAAQIAKEIREGHPLLDSDLRNALAAQGFPVRPTPDKEGCELVQK